MQPASWPARAVICQALLLGAQMANLSPDSRPLPMKALAIRLARVFSSRKVMTERCSTIAGLSGQANAALSNAAGSVASKCMVNGREFWDLVRRDAWC